MQCFQAVSHERLPQFCVGVVQPIDVEVHDVCGVF
jgi:hypothetical protein